MSNRFQIARPRLWVAIGVAAIGLGCSSYESGRLYITGTAALDRGDADRAVADLERAAELRPEASEVQNHLGLAYQAAGRPGDAESAFRRAVALNCENAAASENLRVVEARPDATLRVAPEAP